MPVDEVSEEELARACAIVEAHLRAIGAKHHSPHSSKSTEVTLFDNRSTKSGFNGRDGYPDGQGVTLLAFLRDPANLAALREKAPATRWLTDDEVKATWLDAGVSPTSESEFVSIDIAKKHTEKYPQLSRDTGANILSTVASAPPGIGLVNSIDFAADSLFCEWGYAIDFDKGTFEVYKGWNKSPVPKGERFAGAKPYRPHREDHYYPVRHLVTFQLDALPSDEDFLKACGDGESEEEESDGTSA